MLLTLHQPLRVESGDVTLATASSRNEDGTILFDQSRHRLTPSGREMAIEASYRTALGSFTLDTSIAYRFDANHVAGNNALSAMLFLSRAF